MVLGGYAQDAITKTAADYTSDEGERFISLRRAVNECIPGYALEATTIAQEHCQTNPAIRAIQALEAIVVGFTIPIQEGIVLSAILPHPHELGAIQYLLGGMMAIAGMSFRFSLQNNGVDERLELYRKRTEAFDQKIGDAFLP